MYGHPTYVARVRDVRRNPPPPRRASSDGGGGSSGGSGSLGLIVLLGAGAFLLLSPQGQAMLSNVTGGLGVNQIPAGLPVGTVRLSNGQYRTPTGQVLGQPYAGMQPVAGSATSAILGAAVGAVPTIVSFFSRLFSQTQGGAAAGGATGSPGAGGGVSIPAVGGSGGADVAVMPGGDLGAPSIVFADGSVLDIGSSAGWDFTPWTLTDTQLSLPDWFSSGDYAFDTGGIPDFQAGLDTSGFAFDLPMGDFGFTGLRTLRNGRRAAFLGALQPERRGFVPVPMQHS
jgi:hypothetical protein